MIADSDISELLREAKLGPRTVVMLSSAGRVHKIGSNCKSTGKRCTLEELPSGVRPCGTCLKPENHWWYEVPGLRAKHASLLLYLHARKAQAGDWGNEDLQRLRKIARWALNPKARNMYNALEDEPFKKPEGAFGADNSALNLLSAQVYALECKRESLLSLDEAKGFSKTNVEKAATLWALGKMRGRSMRPQMVKLLTDGALESPFAVLPGKAPFDQGADSLQEWLKKIITHHSKNLAAALDRELQAEAKKLLEDPSMLEKVSIFHSCDGNLEAVPNEKRLQRKMLGYISALLPSEVGRKGEHLATTSRINAKALGTLERIYIIKGEPLNREQAEIMLTLVKDGAQELDEAAQTARLL